MKHYWWQPALIPFTAAAILLQLIYAIIVRPSSIRIRDLAIELIDDTPMSRSTRIWGKPAGQSWGCRVLWFNTSHHAESSIGVHERVHALHGEWCNAAGHLTLIPLAIAVGAPWWCGAIAGQCTFGILYGGHFLWEWIGYGLRPSLWRFAYRRIWSERIAYNVEAYYEMGLRPYAWGGEKYE